MNNAEELLQREIDSLTNGITGLIETRSGIVMSDEEFEEIEEEDTERVEEEKE